MYEGSITPGAHRPKPLTKAQLRELQAKLEGASERIKDIQQDEKLHEEVVEKPKWI